MSMRFNKNEHRFQNGARFYIKFPFEAIYCKIIKTMIYFSGMNIRFL